METQNTRESSSPQKPDAPTGVATCPICRAAVEKSMQKDQSRYFICQSCASVFLSPFPTVEEMRTYAEAQYKDGAYNEYVAARELRTSTFEDRLARFRSFLPEGPIRHLDVGCAAGFMIDVGLKHGFDSYGIEFSEEAINQASPAARARIIHGDVNQLKPSETEKYDLVTCYDIVEHLQDPIAFLKVLRGLLKPSGILVLTTPDSEHWLAKLMGSSWPMLQPYQHTILFSKRAMKMSLEAAGFSEVAATPAYKVLTFQYLTGQLKVVNPVLSKAMSGIDAVVPSSLSKAPVRLNISEFMTIARPQSN